jgi:uncharacterized membrane protein (UPF0127 family)
MRGRFEYDKLMAVRAPTVLLTAVLAVTLVGGCGDDESSQATVRVGDQEVRADVADSPQELSAGLSGRSGLDADEGMLFLLPAPSRQPFWMKGMRFPIDIVWIANGRVSEVTASVPAPAPGTKESELPLYSPRRTVDRVLEMSSGWAKENGVGRGDAVSVSR